MKRKEFAISCILFFIITIFFLWQHSKCFGWDFQAYVLNAKYMFSNGSYFEWGRPPLVPFLIGIFSIFGWKASEYIFITVVSFIHFLSIMFLSKKFKVPIYLLYPLSITPFFLKYSVFEGTELLSLGFLQFFVTFLSTRLSSLFLGLAFLTRYTNLIFFPLLIFKIKKKDLKKPKSLLKKSLEEASIFLLVVSPWLLYNYIYSGHPLTSIMDSYALNIKFRSYIHEPPNILHFVEVINIALPFSILGILSGWKIHKRSYVKILSFLALGIFSYCRIPLKLSRYLFPVLLPCSFFSSRFFQLQLIKNKKILTCFLITSFLTISLVSGVLFTLKEGNIFKENMNFYKNTVHTLKDQIDNCTLASDVYVPLNYLGIKCDIAPRKEILEYKIEKGYRVLLFRNMQINKFVLNKTQDYILLGNPQKCAKHETFNKTYLQSIQELYRLAYNQTFKITAWELFFTKKSA